MLSQETLWKMASAGCYGWKIRAAVRIPAVPVARKNGSVSCTDVELLFQWFPFFNHSLLEISRCSGKGLHVAGQRQTSPGELGASQ